MPRRYTAEQRAALSVLKDALQDLNQAATDYLRVDRRSRKRDTPNWENVRLETEQEVRNDVRDVDTLIREARRLGLSDHPRVKYWMAFDRFRDGIKRRDRKTPSKRERMFLPKFRDDDKPLIAEVARRRALGESRRAIYMWLKREKPYLVGSQSAFYELLERRHL